MTACFILGLFMAPKKPPPKLAEQLFGLLAVQRRKHADLQGTEDFADIAPECLRTEVHDVVAVLGRPRRLVPGEEDVEQFEDTYLRPVSNRLVGRHHDVPVRFITDIECAAFFELESGLSFTFVVVTGHPHCFKACRQGKMAAVLCKLVSWQAACGDREALRTALADV